MSGKRHKGYRPDYKPHRKTRETFAHIKDVLRDYREYLPLTGRQIFYRLVAKHPQLYAKTPQEAARIQDLLVNARRAGIIPWRVIRDGGNAAAEHNEGGYADADEWRDEQRDRLLESAKLYCRDRMDGQAVRIEVWCEAEGMVAQLDRLCAPFGISVFSGGGQPSVTVLYEAARRIADEERPTVLLHIGDLDKAGERIFESSMEDIEAFALGDGRTDFRRVRVALTEAQADDRGLLPLEGEIKVQAEALDPADLLNLLREAIEAEVDLDVRQRVLDQEEEERDALVQEVEDQMP